MSTPDHHHSLEGIETQCRDRGLRMTPPRRAVMEILLNAGQPMGAYAILEELAKAGRPGQPPTVYRALEFLVTNGFAHKVESRSAYTACAHPGKPHTPTFLICRNCSSVQEADTPPQPLARAASEAGFTVEETVLEAQGLCPDCA